MDLLDEALERFHSDLELAKASNVPVPMAVSLATADANGRPSVRTMTLEAAERDGFVFFVNRHSGKAAQLAVNPAAGFCVHWAPIHRQMIVEGTVDELSDTEADAYWRRRHRDTQFGAWASDQSEPVTDPARLERRLVELREQYEYRAVDRPESWLGYRLMPERIEFWLADWHRLHERVRYRKTDDGWTRDRLNP